MFTALGSFFNPNMVPELRDFAGGYALLPLMAAELERNQEVLPTFHSVRLGGIGCHSP